MPLNGLILVKPTSVATVGAGSSATIGTNGSVTFSSCTTLSLNGVFTSTYDNYVVVMRYQGNTSSSFRTYFRLRASGTDSSAASYTWNTTTGNATTVGGERTEDDIYGYMTLHGVAQTQGTYGYIFNPFTTKRTTARFSNVGRASTGPVVWETATRHNLGVSYDGISLIAEGDVITGRIAFYGLRN